MKQVLLRTYKFSGEAELPPTYTFSEETPFSPLLINAFPTDVLSLKQQPVSDLTFIGEAHVPPFRDFTFRGLGREWLVDGNLLYYSKLFGSIASGGYHFEDESLRPIIFDSMVKALSINPDGETPRWALYISTVKNVYLLTFSSDAPVVKKIISSPACGGIGVTVLEKPMGEIPAGTQVVVIPTHRGIYIASENNIRELTPQHSNILQEFDYVHVATKVDKYGQYFLFLCAPKK